MMITGANFRQEKARGILGLSKYIHAQFIPRSSLKSERG